jgi:hypothetical protein
MCGILGSHTSDCGVYSSVLKCLEKAKSEHKDGGSPTF